MSADVAQFQSDMGRAVHIATRTASQIEGALKKAQGVLATLGAGVSFGALYKEALDAAREFEMQQARLQGVLTATGYSAALTGRELNEMGEALANVTRFDKESITQAQSRFLSSGTSRRRYSSARSSSRPIWRRLWEAMFPRPRKCSARRCSRRPKGLRA
jgi:fructoselysine-6-P-deglycase FrlB-like protein